jgi:hypothetical protein
MTTEAFAIELADKMAEQLKKTDLQLCTWSKRYIIRRGSTVALDGLCIKFNGRGPNFIAGSFKAYIHAYQDAAGTRRRSSQRGTNHERNSNADHSAADEGDT